MKDAQAERGASLVEYALLLALIAVVCIVALIFLGGGSKPVFIHDIYYDSPGPDSASNQSLNGEWIQLRNPSGDGVQLQDWTIRDAQGNVYTFGDYTLAAGVKVKIHTGSGSDTPTDRYWGNAEHIWNNDADEATLRKANGNVVDSCSYSQPAAPPVDCD